MADSYVVRILPALLSGAGTTLALFALVFPLSLPLGFLITLCAKCRFRVVRWLASTYIFVMRGTPLMLQLFFVYYGLPFIPIIGPYLRLTSFVAAVLSFTLNYAAYFAEIFRGGLLSIDKGQYEVSHVLGLNSFQTMVRIIIPQMVRVTLPSIGNEAITLVKDTALVASIALPELLNYAKGIVTRDFTTTPFVVAAFIYLCITFVVTMVFKFLESKTNYE